MIGSIVPDRHKKLVTNIRKTNERLKRRKKERDQVSCLHGYDVRHALVLVSRKENFLPILRNVIFQGFLLP